MKGTVGEPVGPYKSCVTFLTNSNPERVRAVSAGDVLRVARLFIDLRAYTVASVGQI